MITHPLIYCDWLEEKGHNVVLLREDLECYSQNRNNFNDIDDGYDCGHGCGHRYGEIEGNGYGYGSVSSYGSIVGDGIGDGCLFQLFNNYTTIIHPYTV